MTTDQKLWWKDFHGTSAFLKMQKQLAKGGFHLKVIFDEKRICTDVHVLKKAGKHQK